MRLLRAVVTIAGPALLASLLSWATLGFLQYIGRVRNVGAPLEAVKRHLVRPVILTVTVAAALAGLPGSDLDDRTRDAVRHGLSVVLIAALSWLLIGALRSAQEWAFRHLQIDVRDNRRARRARTQIVMIRRLVTATIAVVAAAAILMTFERLRAYGASLLASAGLVGIIAGVALQSSLRNLFAGLQLAFSDDLRIDDVVVIEGEWGRVEALSLVSVTVHLWDERRLIVPTTYFTTTPFQNWTRTESRILGSVVLHVDYSAPMAELRAEAHRLIQGSSLWDRRDWVVQVVDTTESTIVVRVLASAHDAGSAWGLRCELREGLLDWLQREQPQALPRMRAQLLPEQASFVPLRGECDSRSA